MLPSTNCSVKFFEPIVIVPLPDAPSTGLIRLPAYLPSPLEPDEPDDPDEPDEPESSESPQPATTSSSTAASRLSRILDWRFMVFQGSSRGWTDEGLVPGGGSAGPAGRPSAR